MNYTIEQTDALVELVNIGMGRAGASLSDLIDDRIELRVPHVVLCSINELDDNREFGELDTSIIQDFAGVTSGRAILAFPEPSARKLGQILAGLEETPAELDFDLKDMLNEVGNIVLNGVLGTVGNMLDSCLEYTVPHFSGAESIGGVVREYLHDEGGERSILVADARFSVASRNIAGSLVLLFDVGGIERVLESLLGEASAIE
ncbi:MAG: chemotaxis protein CheC [Pirellulaceae bacterium]|jgi:chemotaxis protein CheC|nr:chemotaxis protein CheC [Pirellulaceae bacterium]MDP7017367.1 chemotaxis protein CheC [Pirellulaceae bacterium]